MNLSSLVPLNIASRAISPFAKPDLSRPSAISRASLTLMKNRHRESLTPSSLFPQTFLSLHFFHELRITIYVTHVTIPLLASSRYTRRHGTKVHPPDRPPLPLRR